MKPFASISLDLDNKWSYMKTHGDSGWEKYPSYFDILIPHVLDILDLNNLKITFFIVGQDAALVKNQELIRLLKERGHEIANHSFRHDVWLHTYTKDELKEDILEAEKQISQITGQKPVGFRGPGFSYSMTLFEVLWENKYIYDASLLPTYLGPLARAYYFWKSDLDTDEKKQRKALYGGLREGLKPVTPFLWQLPFGATMLEIPVTTIPIIKTPFHLSYLLYLNRFSHIMMLVYLKIALTVCQITKTEPSFLLHPLDFLDAEQVPELSFFPGMDLHRSRKIKSFNKVIDMISRHFNLVNMSTHAASIGRQQPNIQK